MTTVTIDTAEPVGAGFVPYALDMIAGLPPVLNIVSRGLQVHVTFNGTLDAGQVSTVKSYGATLPLLARISRYTKLASEQCGDVIVSGVQSDATGTMYFYDSDVEAQLNIVGAVVSNTDTFWHVRDTEDGPKFPVQHTPAQLVAVGQAIKTWKEERIYVFQTFKTQLNACTTTAQCDALWATWDPLADPVFP